MAFIDELGFHISAGKGGNGVERWRHEKGKEYSGAAGGNGGKGGDVYMRAVRDLGILARYRNTKSFDAQNGEDGMKNSMHGADGKDLIIDVPIGSVITDLRTVETGGPGVKKGEGRKITLLTEGETVRILKGGRGGLGNEHFKASTNVRPTETTDGKAGEEGDFKVDVELVADAGFIGLPNAGKSSLLNAFTNADAKVGAYQFTTLEPNLGAMRSFVLADIPGLIEGAAEGKGLGLRFLRHIERNSILLFIVPIDSADIRHDYKILLSELSKYSPELLTKHRILAISKCDLADEELIKMVGKDLKKKLVKEKGMPILFFSAATGLGVENLKDEIMKMLDKSNALD